MARGTILGLRRPLAEGELIFRSAFDVTDEYGANLENNEFRANEEDKIEQVAVDVLGSQVGDNISVQLSPAGNISGVNISTGVTEILSRETRGSILSEDDLVRLLNESVDRINGIVGFRIPTPFPVGFGEVVDEPYYSIESR